jgi:hypothetical protein
MAETRRCTGSRDNPMSAFDGLSRTILLCRDYVSDQLSNEDLCQNLQSIRVLCISNVGNLSSYSGQTALVTMVSLLNRMGMQVALQIPEITIVGPQVPFRNGSLRERLLESSGAIISGAHVQNDVNFQPDLTFVLGDTEFQSEAVFWRLHGNDWTGHLTVGDSAKLVSSWQSAWTVGSMVAAALAANEAFKFALRRLEFRDERNKEFFEPSRTCGFDFGAVWIPRLIDLGNVDLISGGAITQSVLYALLRFPGVQMSGRVYDDDITNESNLNRNMLTIHGDIEMSKAQLIADRCAARFQLKPINSRFTADLQVANLASHVLVGVDDIPSRWEVQRRSFGWLAVAGTSHFSISSSHHSDEMPCCGCLHPVDDADANNVIPTISFVSFWAGLATAVRLIKKCVGYPYGREKQHLWLTPLRLDKPNAAMWLPVQPVPNCPVSCAQSRQRRR